MKKKLQFTILVIHSELIRKYLGMGAGEGFEAILECKKGPGLKKFEKHCSRYYNTYTLNDGGHNCNNFRNANIVAREADSTTFLK